MLTIQNLTVSAQGKTILFVEQAQLNAGSHMAILGPNGAGKSSLLKSICGQWTTGTRAINFHGQSISKWNRAKLARHLGVLPQASQIEFPFTVSEVVSLGATPLVLKKKEINIKVLQYLRMTGTTGLANKNYSQLSGGEKQRVQLARVLLQLSQAEDTPLLLLDEPTSAQDLGFQHELMKLVRALCDEQHFGVLSVLHDLNLACRYCDGVWLIDQKKLFEQGHPERVLTPSSVQRHWQYYPEKVTTDRQSFALL